MMRMMRWVRLLLIVVALLWAAPSRAATYTVCASGCDYDCASWQTALSGCGTNTHTYQLAEGLVCTGLTFTAPNGCTATIIGLGSGATLDGNGAVSKVLYLSTGSSAENITIQNATIDCVAGTGDQDRGYSLTNVTIANCGASCVGEFDHAFGGAFDRLTLTDCGGYAIEGASDVCVVSNVVADGWSTHGIRCSASSVVEHCTVTGGTGTGYAIWTTGVGRYNIAADNATTVAGLNITTSSYNISHGHTTNYTSAKGTGDTEDDPLFVDAAGGDFRIQADSPAVGKAVGSSQANDRTGVNTRVDGSPDGGAYEYVASGLPAGVWGRNGITRDWGVNGTAEAWGANGSSNGGPR